MFAKSLTGTSMYHNDLLTRDCEDDPACWYRRAHLAIAGDLRVDVDTKLDTFDLFNQAFCAADGNEPLQIAICKQYIERAERPR